MGYRNSKTNKVYAPENPPEYYKKEQPESIEQEADPIDVEDALFERDAVDVLEEMCTQSLPPELYEKWVEVVGMLRLNRRAFNPAFSLDREWQNGDKVQIVFPGNGKLQGKIIKVAFPRRGEPLYDVEIPFEHWDYDGEPDPKATEPKTGFFRIHGLRQWFLSHTQEDWDKMRSWKG